MASLGAAMEIHPYVRGTLIELLHPDDPLQAWLDARDAFAEGRAVIVPSDPEDHPWFGVILTFDGRTFIADVLTDEQELEYEGLGAALEPVIKKFVKDGRDPETITDWLIAAIAQRGNVDRGGGSH